MTWRGVFSGALALIALQVVVSRADAADRVGTGFQWLAQLVTSAIDPSVPAIPDLAGYSGQGIAPAPGEDWGWGKYGSGLPGDPAAGSSNEGGAPVYTGGTITRPPKPGRHDVRGQLDPKYQ